MRRPSNRRGWRVVGAQQRGYGKTAAGHGGCRAISEVCGGGGGVGGALDGNGGVGANSGGGGEGESVLSWFRGKGAEVSQSRPLSICACKQSRRALLGHPRCSAEPPCALAAIDATLLLPCIAVGSHVSSKCCIRHGHVGRFVPAQHPCGEARGRDKARISLVLCSSETPGASGETERPCPRIDIGESPCNITRYPAQGRAEHGEERQPI